MSTTQPSGMICTGEEGDGCGRPMRGRGVLLRDAPNTVAMGYGGKCKSCQSTYVPLEEPQETSSAKADDPQRMSQTVSDLEAWMNRNRGVARESTNPVQYRAGERGAA